MVLLNMRTTTNLSVKGTRYYKAAELLQKDSLLSSTAIRLEHQPHNPHDKNAVAVRVKRTGAMLGHISREVAAKYVELLNSGKVIEASVTKIAKEGPYINIDVRAIMYLT
jgi:HIRAN domain